LVAEISFELRRLDPIGKEEFDAIVADVLTAAAKARAP